MSALLPHDLFPVSLPLPCFMCFLSSPFSIHLSAEPPLTMKLWRGAHLYNVNGSPHSHCSQFRDARSFTYIWFVNLKKKKNHRHCQGIKRGKKQHWEVGLVSLATGNSDSNTYMGNKSCRSSPDLTHLLNRVIQETFVWFGGGGIGLFIFASQMQCSNGFLLGQNRRNQNTILSFSAVLIRSSNWCIQCSGLLQW